MLRHEAGWDNGKIFCSCGWISQPSIVEGAQQQRKDQQTQFIQHRFEQANSVQLGEGDDSNQ